MLISKYPAQDHRGTPEYGEAAVGLAFAGHGSGGPQPDVAAVAVGDVDGDGHILALGFGEDGVEVGVGEEAVAFQRLHTDGDGAVLLGEPNLVDGFVDHEVWDDAGPAEAALALLPDVGEPLVPGAAEGCLSFGPSGDGFEPDGVVEYLNVDTKLVHVVEAHLYVVHLAGFFGCTHGPASVLGNLLDLLLAEGREVGSAEFAIYEPIVTYAFIGRGVEQGAELLFRRLQIVPSAFSFHHMGIGVDDLQFHLCCHMVSPCSGYCSCIGECSRFG